MMRVAYRFLMLFTLLVSYGCETEYIDDDVYIVPGGYYSTITTYAEVTSIGEFFYSQKCTIRPTVDDQTGALTLEFFDVAFAAEMEPTNFSIAGINPSPSYENVYTGSNLKPIVDGEEQTAYNISYIAVKYDGAVTELIVTFTCVTTAPTYGAAQYKVTFTY